MANAAPTFMIEGAELKWKNFSGAPTPVNPDGGKRTFNVVLDKQTADRMTKDEWNVKCKPSGVPSEEGEDDVAEEFCHLEIAVRFDIRPPKIIVITETARTIMTEDTVGMLDYADIRNVDIFVQGSHWSVGGKEGVKAYLQTMYVTIEENPLERKYAQMDLEEGR